ncbi:phosphoinositide 3-kinase regulatory subunit 4-like [Mya arenaria]|uniref:phosphoinositide 3-kinase regulatory subunit 4-like n=1 Tax=Mya arenaria TaxID=6604 RepID=UPI0022E0477F|nr:phosphoinositide 3-kinase regulatory subunit 4-like [Mya arenaria]
MGNQLTGIAPSQILPVEHYLTDTPEAEFDISLGSTRFFKVARAKTKEGLTVVKVFVIHDPSLPLSSYKTRLEEICATLQGTSNCIPFQKAVQQDKAALLYRQYVKDSLYDRISTRPFLIPIEKKWIACQLLCALNQCHKLKVCHGDIKSENVMITGWNWLLLTDFASFKPTYLPDDNPSDFSYFFDTSRRRTCYIAPERFVDSGTKNSDTGNQGNNVDLTASGEVKTGELTPAMDIFSAGCVISELFTDGTPPFDLSQLLAYRNREYSPWKVLEKIDDQNVRDLVRHMMQKEPSHRLSAEEYLIQQRLKTFPDYFYTFLKLYIQRFASTPIMPPDEKIFKVNRDMVLIKENLKIDPAHPENNSALVLIISLVGSSSRQATYCNAKLVALNLMTEFSKYVTADIILDRLLPYVIHMSKDKEARVRAEMLHCITRCLKDIQNVPKSDVNVFQEYIFSNLSHLVHDSSTVVRAAFAENIAQLAESALRVLEMMQLGDIDDQNVKDEAANFSTYDQELHALQEIIQEIVVALLNDLDNSVKRSLLDNNGITRLCVFFGRQKANDVLLSHMITFLNDKADWHLRAAFFDNIVGIAAYVGWQSSEIIKPLIEQGLSDPEEYIVHRSLGCIKSLTELGLLQKQMLHYFIKIVIPLLAHPGIWVRQGSAGFISAVAGKLNIADIHCNMLPNLQPFLTSSIIQIEKEVLLLNSLQDPIPRQVFDYILRSTHVERIFNTLKSRNSIRELSRQNTTPPYCEMDETMSQIFKRLSFLGCVESHEDKLLAMKDFILKLHRARAGNTDMNSHSETKPGQLDIRLLAGSTRRHADLYKPKDTKGDSNSSPNSRRKKKSPGPETQSKNMNPEWKSMFGSTSSLGSSPRSKTPYKPETSAVRPVTPAGSQSSSTGSLVAVSQLSIDSSMRSLGIGKGEKQAQQTRYAQCKWELRDLVKKRRGQYSADLATRDLLEGIAWESRPPPSNWKPRGLLVAHLHEHRGPVNRLSVCYDHSYFASCSNDGMVRLWECGKLEGKNMANRSKHSIAMDGAVKLVTFFEGSHMLAASSDKGVLNVYDVESGKPSEVDTQLVNVQGQGHIVDMAHFDTGNQSILAYATVNGDLVGWDLRCRDVAWVLKNDPKTGLITSFSVHQSQCWLGVGTSSGKHVCWDLRFQLPITTIEHPAGSRVRRLVPHPTEQSWMISAVQGNNEVSMWDIETGARRKALWASSVPTLSKTQESPHAVYGMHVGITDSSTFLLTGGSDMRVRFWDLSYPANSFIMANAAGDPTQQTAVSYRSRIIEGTEVIEETYSKKPTTNDDTPKRGPEAPPQGHNDIITDVSLCQASQCLVITASRNGIVKVWK